MSRLIEHNGCIFDKAQLAVSGGYQAFDFVEQEAFVNHIHFDELDREVNARQLVELWEHEVKSKWPSRAFRIYVHEAEEEITVRFHQVRSGLPNWCERESEELKIRTINATRTSP
jgi:hypothetical protein